MTEMHKGWSANISHADVQNFSNHVLHASSCVRMRVSKNLLLGNN